MDMSARRACAMCADHVAAEFLTSLCPCDQGGVCPPCFLNVWMREKLGSVPRETYLNTTVAHGGSASGAIMASQPQFSREDLEDLAQFAQEVASAPPQV
jgi:GTP cyclohydrolase FolE2